MEEAKAIGLAEANLKNTKQVLYIINVKDPNEVFYVTGKYLHSANVIEAVGFFSSEVSSETKKQSALQKIKTVQEALDCAKKLKLEIREVQIPWHRISLIENLTAKTKHNKA